MPTDPVCLVTVNEDEAKGTSEYEGRTYYFCSTGCKVEFDEDPGRFANSEQLSA